VALSISNKLLGEDITKIGAKAVQIFNENVVNSVR
jgi:hypothetical protein